MKDELFEDLLQSVREGGAILRREVSPAAAFSGDPDVVEVRERYGLSQAKFAGLLGISVRTLQNWEQRRRSPEGPARVLLRVAARHPEAVLDTVRQDAAEAASSGSAKKPVKKSRTSFASSRKTRTKSSK